MGQKEAVTIACGELLKDLRLLENMTQSRLAKIMKSDRTYISMIERGERRITLASLERISVGLNVPIDTVLSSLAERLRSLCG